MGRTRARTLQLSVLFAHFFPTPFRRRTSQQRHPPKSIALPSFVLKEVVSMVGQCFQYDAFVYRLLYTAAHNSQTTNRTTNYLRVPHPAHTSPTPSRDTDGALQPAEFELPRAHKHHYACNREYNPLENADGHHRCSLSRRRPHMSAWGLKCAAQFASCWFETQLIMFKRM